MTKKELKVKIKLLETKVEFYGDMLMQKDDLVNNLINEINKANLEKRLPSIHNVIDIKI